MNGAIFATLSGQMPLQKDRAIVLSKRAFGESDRIIKLFTFSSGKVSAIAKGAGKSQKRFANTLEPFNVINVEYFEKTSSSMVRIDNADVLETNSGIELSLKRACTAGFFAEFTERLTKERQPHEALFGVLLAALRAVRAADLQVAAILGFELKILEALGYMPNFRTCVYCGKEIPDEEKTRFSRERGGVLCPACCRFLSYRQYPPAVLPYLSCLSCSSGSERNDLLDGYASDVMEGFVAFHLDVECRSYRILKGLVGGRARS